MAHASEIGCFERHLKDAIQINSARAPIYSSASGGASLSISKKLVFFERHSISVARLLQAHAKKFQEKGIPVLCDDFVSMEQAPEIPVGGKTSTLPQDRFVNRPVVSLTSELLAASLRRDNEALVEVATREIDELKAQPSYHCLRRHFLESIARAARLVSVYTQMAREAEMSSPEGISRMFINAQILSLGYASNLDRQAAPVQEQGVPVLCADVPTIQFDSVL